MNPASQPALLSNIRLNDEEKFEFFRTTLRDVADILPEAHLKFRGRYAGEAAAFARTAGFRSVTLYQELQERDWVAATRAMLRSIRSRSVFLYFEDHRLVSEPERLRAAIAEFEALQADVMCYSFFRASHLGRRNLLPFDTTYGETIDAIHITDSSLALLGRVSPKYYTFSLLSLVSVAHFDRLLAEEDVRWKIHGRRLSALATILFPYPGYRRALRRWNAVLRRLGCRLCYYHPSSPFNLERMWLETAAPASGLRIAVPRQELFANCDDDNGADGESLIKRGRYPLLASPPTPAAALRSVNRTVTLAPQGALDLTYHSAVDRIRNAPRVRIRTSAGSVTLRTRDGSRTLRVGEEAVVYSNVGGQLTADQPSTVQLEIFDEAF